MDVKIQVNSAVPPVLCFTLVSTAASSMSLAFSRVYSTCTTTPKVDLTTFFASLVLARSHAVAVAACCKDTCSHTQGHIQTARAIARGPIQEIKIQVFIGNVIARNVVRSWPLGCATSTGSLLLAFAWHGGFSGRSLFSVGERQLAFIKSGACVALQTGG